MKSVFHFMACQRCPCLNLSYSPFIPCNPSIHPPPRALLTKHLRSVFFFIWPSSYEDPSAESFSRHLSVIHPVTCFFPLGYHAGILFFQKTLCRKYRPSSFLAHHRSKSSQKMSESSGEERGLYKIWWGIEMRRRCENGWECDTAKIQRPGLARKM